MSKQWGSGNQAGVPDFTAANVNHNICLSSRATDTKAQFLRILAALRLGPKTTDDLRALGIYQVSARIFELRALGYSIRTSFLTAHSREGYRHQRMALYTLNEPGGVQA
ncbi:helix-turn-helix domain-containing protein [Variovorax sp.]|uniref:helix-turn-helix domain-containing protein n=1 Tax=Variovorax sp. TaxID=1871043 RepID=UPI0025D7C66B|nr:helix-turn-helix domain-containing protein [Variovorax sp.]